MLKIFIVALGGAVGAALRYITGLALSPFSTGFPLSTLLINTVGSLLIGIISSVSQVTPVPTNVTLFLSVGICGGFTTFSTFSLETVNLLENGKFMLAALYATSSLFFCFTGVVIGKTCIKLFV